MFRFLRLLNEPLLISSSPQIKSPAKETTKSLTLWGKAINSPSKTMSSLEQQKNHIMWMGIVRPSETKKKNRNWHEKLIQFIKVKSLLANDKLWRRKWTGEKEIVSLYFIKKHFFLFHPRKIEKKISDSSVKKNKGKNRVKRSTTHRKLTRLHWTIFNLDRKIKESVLNECVTF